MREGRPFSHAFFVFKVFTKLTDSNYLRRNMSFVLYLSDSEQDRTIFKVYVSLNRSQSTKQVVRPNYAEYAINIRNSLMMRVRSNKGAMVFFEDFPSL